MNMQIFSSSLFYIHCLLKTCRDCYLEQIVDQNTRARGDNTLSLIDLILCYDPAEIEHLKYLSPLGKSDHCIILFDYITLCEKKSRVGLI